MPLAAHLKPQDNSAAIYFPIAARSDKSNEFDWEIVTRFFVGALFSIESNEKKLIGFQQRCKEHFLLKLSDPKLWGVIEQIYFSKRNIKNIAPEMLIFSGSWDAEANPAPAERIVNVMMTLLGDMGFQSSDNLKLNFIEKELRKVFQAEFKTTNSAKQKHPATPYLPAVAEMFQQDLQFLLTKQHYFLAHLKHFLRFYLFIYTTQLALAINSWKDGAPQRLRNCYFILDTEKASKERSMLQQWGCKRVEQDIEYLFPVLAMNESLQDGKQGILPMWALHEQLVPEDLGKLITYVNLFAVDRKLSVDTIGITSVPQALEALLKLSKQQFDSGKTRSGPGNNYINFTKTEICGPFTRTRGSAGKVFVLDQEFLLLLTNLAIGEQGSMRLHELIVEFKKRGVFLDRESQTALVEFYERLGNVERMSDSGDAVYVKATI